MFLNFNIKEVTDMENGAPIWIIYVPENASYFYYLSGYDFYTPENWDYRVVIHNPNWGYFSQTETLQKAIKFGIKIYDVDKVITRIPPELLEPYTFKSFWRYRPYWPVPPDFPRAAFALFYQILKQHDEYVQMAYFDVLAGFDPWLNDYKIY